MGIHNISHRALLGLGAGSLLLLGGVVAGPIGTFAHGSTTPAVAVVSSDSTATESGVELAPAAEQATETTVEAPDAALSASVQAQVQVNETQAKAAALAANAGTSVSQVTLDDENGHPVYSVTLSNGAEVKVDAANATILPADSQAGDQTGGQ